MDEAQHSKLERRWRALMDADLEKFSAGLVASGTLCETLNEDFCETMNRMVEHGSKPSDRRDVVRCFGSLLDGLTASMRFAAVALCKVFDEPLNPFLTDKTAERGLSTHQRIRSIYRLLAGFLPKSPLARLSDARWDQLHWALDIRNRVVHPSVPADLDLSNDEMNLVMQTGLDFYSDFTQFIQWFSQKEQQMLWELPGTRQRYLKKIGRNEPCPCGSGRKYKNCCGPSSQP
jgi:hypothetical protein